MRQLTAASNSQAPCRGAPFTPIHICARVGKPIRKHEQAQTREGRRGRKIEEAFEKENAEHACDRQVILPGEQERAHRLSRPPKTKSRQSPSPFP